MIQNTCNAKRLACVRPAFLLFEEAVTTKETKNMNTLLKATLLVCVAVGLPMCRQAEKYPPEQYLKPGAQKMFLYSIARYAAKMPKGARHNTKTGQQFDSYYQREMEKYRLEKYFIASDSTHYFLVSRPAPSLQVKRVAIGGRVKYDRQGGFSFYEEVFRTWKMKEDEMTRKAGVLFERMIEVGDVEPYLPANTEEEWVEFPDKLNYFDTAARRWKMKGQNDSLQYQPF